MSFSEFGLNVFASWIANQLDKIKDNLESVDNQNSEIVSMNDSDEISIPLKKQFHCYDILYHLVDVFKQVQSPVAHWIIEKEPSGFYNLVCMVVESKLTGEWYVFD